MAAVVSAAPAPDPTPIPHERAIVLDALTKSAKAFAAVRSFRSRVSASDGLLLAEYLAPNVMRFSGVSESAVMVGDKTYAKAGGRWHPVVIPNGVFVRDLVMLPRIMVQWARLTTPVFVHEFQSHGESVRIYRYVSYDRHTQLITTVWIGTRDNLPRYAAYDTMDSHTTVEYNDYNKHLDFGRPPQN